jgi:AcrR family transcriptional regulator
MGRRADVDPALVHHYFKGKAALFTEALKFGRDPREIVFELSQSVVSALAPTLSRRSWGLWESRSPAEQGRRRSSQPPRRCVRPPRPPPGSVRTWRTCLVADGTSPSSGRT